MRLSNWLRLPDVLKWTWWFLFRNVKLSFEVLFYLSCPLWIFYLSLLKHHLIKCVMTLLMKFVQMSQAVVKQSHKLHRLSCPRSCRVTLVASLYRRPHLVHPSQTVQLIPSVDKTGVLVNCKLNVESFSHHVWIYFVPGSPFSVINPMSVGLNDLLNDLFDSHRFCFSLLFPMVMLDHVVWKEQHVYFFLENLVIVGLASILFDASDEPPACVSAVVARIVSIVEEIRDHSMSEGGGKL